MSQTKTQLVASPLNLNGADLTFPSAQGSAGQYLRNSSTAGTLEFANGGKILKTQTISNNIYTLSNSGSWLDALSFSYTPVSSTSTLHFICSPHTLIHWTDQNIAARLLWNNNPLTTINHWIITGSATGSWYSGGNAFHVSTTSGVTSPTNFKLQMSVNSGSQYWYVNYPSAGNAQSYLTVFEVEA